jgi:prefoldin subunit 5
MKGGKVVQPNLAEELQKLEKQFRFYISNKVKFQGELRAVDTQLNELKRTIEIYRNLDPPEMTVVRMKQEHIDKCIVKRNELMVTIREFERDAQDTEQLMATIDRTYAMGVLGRGISSREQNAEYLVDKLHFW